MRRAVIALIIGSIPFPNRGDVCGHVDEDRVKKESEKKEINERYYQTYQFFIFFKWICIFIRTYTTTFAQLHPHNSFCSQEFPFPLIIY